MRIEVYVRDKVLSINVGVGTNRLKWLAEAATLRYDPNAMLSTGEPKLIKTEDGTVLNMNDRISDRLVDNARIWIHYEDLSVVPEKKVKKK